MIKKLIFSIVALVVVTTANAEEIRIAYSKADNVDILAKNPSSNGEWCTDNVEVNVASTNSAANVSEQALDLLIAKVGVAVIEKNCPAATQMTIYQHSDGALIGAALKNGQWVIIRDAANEDDPPSSDEEVLANQVAASVDTLAAHEKAQAPKNLPSKQEERSSAVVAAISLTVKPDMMVVQSQLAQVKESGRKDMPFNEVNEQRYSELFTDKTQNYEMRVGEDEGEAIVKISKEIIEKELGYNYDLSFRRAFLFENLDQFSVAGRIFFADYKYIYGNLDKSLSAGYISRRTYDIISGKNKIPSDKQLKFMALTQECQMASGGLCHVASMLSLMKRDGVFTGEIPRKGSVDRSFLSSNLTAAYQLSSGVCDEGWVVLPNDELVNCNWLLGEDDTEFKLNAEAIGRAMNTLKIKEEEKEFFNQIASMNQASSVSPSSYQDESAELISANETVSDHATSPVNGNGSWMLWLVLLSSVFVLLDAKRIGVKKGVLTGMGNMGPWSWFFGSLLLWIVVFPLYFFYRGKYKVAIQQASTPVQPTASMKPVQSIDDLEKMAALRDKGLISAEEFERKKAEILGL